MVRRFARSLLPLVALATSHAANVQKPTPPAAIPGVRVELEPLEKSFRQGDPVRLKLRFVYDGDGNLNVGTTVFSMSDRISEFRIRVTAPDGKPLPDPYGGETFAFTSPPGTKFRDLSRDHPCEFEIVANDWALLTEPGRYSIVADTCAVDTKPNARKGFWAFGGHPKLSSNSVDVAITPCGLAEREEQIQRAAGDLENSDPGVREKAILRLGYLLDPKAIPLLVKALEDPNYPCRARAQAGLAIQPDLQPVKAALLDKLDREGSSLPAIVKYPYAVLLTAADQKQTPGKPRYICGYFPEILRQVDEKMTKNLEQLPPKQVLGRLFALSLSGREATPIPLAQKELALEAAASFRDGGNWTGHTIGDAAGHPKPNPYWVAVFIETACEDPALTDDLQNLAAKKDVSIEIRMAAYDVAGRISNTTLPPLTDVDPSNRSPQWIMTPDKPTISDESEKRTVTFRSFTGTDNSLGRGMLPGIEYRTVWKRGEKTIDTRTRYLTGLDTGQDMKFWDQDFPRQTKSGNPSLKPGDQIESTITFFESDLPPQHDWAPRTTSKFRALWEKTFVTAVP